MNNSHPNSNPHTTVQIPNYQIKETVYEGSRTLVYRAIRTHDLLPVVIKLLKNDYPTFSELVQFRNQYTIAKNLARPGIIQTYSLEPYQNGYALVMEDFGGISLQEWAVKGKKALSLREFLQIAIALCDTLDILYRERIIHKDIKPSNILMNPETKQVKLIDFSIASLLPRETQTLINPNVLEGTLAYISPEQTGRMNRGIDYRTDFYSLGVTFYELLTGELPFQANDAMELVHCHIAKASPLVQEINSEIPSILSKIVNKLMAKNAEERYQSAWGLKFDLENCLHQLQVSGKIENFEIGQRDVCDRFLIPDKLYGRETETQTLLQAFERVASGVGAGSPTSSVLHQNINKPAPTTPSSLQQEISTGKTEIMLVAGFSGIGKTAVVNEVHKPIVRQRGYFIKGKFDQFQRNIPLSAFVQAFRDLMEQLLTESDVPLERWRNQILAAVGENGQVIIEVIPELERIVGKQPSVLELSGNAAQNRFNLLLEKFIQVFATKEHPLVIFIDDLQWADSASLKLMHLLMSKTDSQYLLLIGAYRDNEVSDAHPLMLTLQELEKAKATINTIMLAPLNRASINQLVADTLSCSLDLALPLTDLAISKTKGNPFFTTQFLKALHEDGLITFNPPQSPTPLSSPLTKGGRQGGWQCDIAQVRSLSLTSDVVEFMAGQLLKLPPETQTVIKLAACIGAQFDLNTLAIVSEQSQTEVATALWKALQEGLILPISEVYKFYQQESLVNSHLSFVDEEQQITNDQGQITVSYKFLHDRVQQAAYSLIPDDRKQRTHYRIGQLLLQQISSAAREERIFEVVNQLNYGNSLITQQTERDELAELNLIACRKAKSSTAYQAAREYAEVGLSLLGENAWQQQYEMSLAFNELAAEVTMLGGDFKAMEQFIDIVTQQAHSLLEQVDVYRIRILASSIQNKPAEALGIGLKLLQQLGIRFPEVPTPTDVQQSMQEISDLIGDREIESFVDLPVMTNARTIAIIQIVSRIITPAYISGSPLFPLLIALSVKLSLQHGNIAASGYNYVCYSILVCTLLQDVDLAVQFGQLALNVAFKPDAKAIQPEVSEILGTFIFHRKSHIKETLPLLREGYATGLEVGNLQYALYNANCLCLNTFWCGQPLATLEQDTCAYYNAAVQFNQLRGANYLRTHWQLFLNLLGFADHPTLLSGSALQETEFVPQLRSANDLYGLYYFYLYKLILGFLFGEVESANNHALECRNYLAVSAGTVADSAFYFYDSLIALALLSQGLGEESIALERVAQNQTQLQHWADHAPMNYQHKVDLVEAEKCRVLRQTAAALDLYDRAIALAKEHGYIQEEALANELAAKFYLNWGKELIAQSHITQAYYGYTRWGAKAKVADLERRYPQLLAPILQQTRSPLSTSETIFAMGSVTSTTSNSSVSDSLDLKAILKASQTISGEIELEKLLSSLLSIVIENAGADKCVLMLLRDNDLAIEGSITLGSKPVVLQHLPIEDSQDIPLKLICKVKNNRQTAVLINAIADLSLAHDLYIMRQQPKSILCSPILHQGKLLGILYLENTLVTGAFTSDRVELLNFLCAQAAISLENARLFHESKQAEIDLQQSNAFLEAQRESSLDGILVVDRDRQIRSYNQRFLDLWRVPPELRDTRDDRKMLAFVVGEVADSQAFLEQVLYLYEHINEFSHCELLLKDGRTIERTSVPVNSGERENWGRIWYFRDISDRKQAELELQKLAAVVENSTDFIGIATLDGQGLYVNSAGRRLVGLDNTVDILSLNMSNFHSLETITQLQQTILPEVMQRGAAQTDLHLQHFITKEQIPVNYNICIINDPQTAQPMYFAAIMRDIRDRKQTEAELQQKEQFLRSIYDGAEILIVVTDVMTDGSFRYAGSNPATEKLVGIREIDVVGKTPVEVYGEQAGGVIQNIFAKCVASGVPISTEDLLTLNGEEKWFLATHNPLKNEKGQICRIITTTIDISDRKRAEADILQKSQELEQALQNLQQTQLQMIQSEKMSALGNLVAGIAHEINNPVGFISGNLSEAKSTVQDLVEHLNLYRDRAPETELADHAKDIDLDYIIEDLPKMIDSMQLGCDRIKSISTSLRTFSRADKDYKVLFNIHDGIDSTILILKYRLKANDERPAIEVVKDYSNIPAINCFPGQLNQVFMNILANAIDALDESNLGRSFAQIKANPNRIKITTSGDNQQVKITIADNGRGMSEEVKAKIFDHLFTTKAVGKGTGLGLAIARQIIEEKHGGSIQVNSILREGTQFIITLPIKGE